MKLTVRGPGTDRTGAQILPDGQVVIQAAGMPTNGSGASKPRSALRHSFHEQRQGVFQPLVTWA